MYNIKVKKLNKSARLPVYATEHSAGADLFACMDTELEILPGDTCMVHTGISMEIPEGYVGLVFARSGLALRAGLAPANKVGVVDSDYRGEFMVAIYNHGSMKQRVGPGERIAQLVIVPYEKALFIEAEELECTERGTGGFGSTGK